MQTPRNHPDPPLPRCAGRAHSNRRAARPTSPRILLALATLAVVMAGCDGSKTGSRRPAPPALSLFVTGGLNMQVEPCGCKDRLGGHYRRATVFRQFEAAHPGAPVLYLDAGQAFKLDSPEVSFAVPAMKEAMRALGLDGLSPGAFELAQGVATVLDSLEGAGFPLTSANLRNIDDGTPVLAPYLLLRPRRVGGGTAEGPRVGVIGVAVMERYRILEGRNGTKAHLVDPVKAVAEYVAEVRGKSDIVIVLGNIGRGLARQLSEKHPEIDLIIATDPHVGDEKKEPGPNAPIYFTGLLGKRQLRFDFVPAPRGGGKGTAGGTQRPWSVIGNITSINDSIPGDPDARSLMKRYADGQSAAGFGSGVTVRGGK